MRIRHWLKPCPRCRGGLLLEHLHTEGRQITCTLCGYRLSSDEMRMLVSDMIGATEDRTGVAA